jgi:hypothetical protein
MVHLPVASTTTVEPSPWLLLVGIWPVASPALRGRLVGKVPVGVAIGGLSPLFNVTIAHVLEFEDVIPPPGVCAVAADTPRPNVTNDERTLCIAVLLSKGGCGWEQGSRAIGPCG